MNMDIWLSEKNHVQIRDKIITQNYNKIIECDWFTRLIWALKKQCANRACNWTVFLTFCPVTCCFHENVYTVTDG